MNTYRMYLYNLIVLQLLLPIRIFGQEWIKLNDMSTARMSFGFVPFEGKIYAIGGEGIYISDNKPTYLKTVEVYDPLTNTWSVKKDMPIALSFCRTAVLDGKIYVLGGETNDLKYSSIVFEYNPIEDLWTEKSNIPQGFSLFGSLNSVVVDSIIYLQSGNHFYLYEPSKNKWDSITLDREMPALNYLVVNNNKIISVCGGDWTKETTEILEYDFSSNAWTVISNASVGIAEHTALIIDEYLYIIGGCNGTLQTLLNQFNSLKINENQWANLTNLPIKLHFPGIANIGKKIYVAGGSNGLYRFSGHQKTLYMYNLDLSDNIGDIVKDTHLVFPNPNKGLFQITLPYSSSSNIEILNSLGQKVYQSQTFKEEYYSIDLRMRPAGLYYYTIDNKYIGKIEIIK